VTAVKPGGDTTTTTGGTTTTTTTTTGGTPIVGDTTIVATVPVDPGDLGTTTGSFGSEASFLAQDAAYLHSQGLSTAQIKTALLASGASEAAATYGATYAGYGYNADQIQSTLNQHHTDVDLYPTVTSTSTAGTTGTVTVDPYADIKSTAVQLKGYGWTAQDLQNWMTSSGVPADQATAISGYTAPAAVPPFSVAGGVNVQLADGSTGIFDAATGVTYNADGSIADIGFGVTPGAGTDVAGPATGMNDRSAPGVSIGGSNLSLEADSYGYRIPAGTTYQNGTTYQGNGRWTLPDGRTVIVGANVWEDSAASQFNPNKSYVTKFGEFGTADTGTAGTGSSEAGTGLGAGGTTGTGTGTGAGTGAGAGTGGPGAGGPGAGTVDTGTGTSGTGPGADTTTDFTYTPGTGTGTGTYTNPTDAGTYTVTPDATQPVVPGTTGGGGTGTTTAPYVPVTPIIPGGSRPAVITRPAGTDDINNGTARYDPTTNTYVVDQTVTTTGNTIGTTTGTTTTDTTGTGGVVGGTTGTVTGGTTTANTVTGGTTGGTSTVTGNVVTGGTTGAVVPTDSTGNVITTVATPVIPGGTTGGSNVVVTNGNTVTTGGNVVITSTGNVIGTGGTTGGNVGNVVVGPVIPGGNVVGNVGGTGGNVVGNVVGNTTGTGNVITIGTGGNVVGNIGGTGGNVVGNVGGTGNVVGNVITVGNTVTTGNVVGNVTGNITGNTTGNVTGNVTGNTSVTGNVVVPVTPIIPDDDTPYTPTPFTPLTFKTLPDLKLPGLNPGFIAPQPYYQNTNQVQSKFFYGARPYQPGPTFNQALYDQVAAPVTPWGLQQMYSPEDLAKYYANQQVKGPVVPR
jgi:hypothetical protein